MIRRIVMAMLTVSAVFLTCISVPPAFSKHIVKDYDDSEGLANVLRGRVYAENHEYDMALEQYNKALKLNPMSALAYHRRGLLYDELGEKEKALSDLNKAAGLDPSNANIFNSRGKFYDAEGKHDLALADYAKAIKILPSMRDLYLNRGIAYFNKGEYDRALADFGEELKNYPSNPGAIFYTRVIITFNGGDYDTCRNTVISLENLKYKVSPLFVENLKMAQSKRK